MKTNVSTNDGILYSGNVYIQYKYGKTTNYIRAHNEGKISLFTAITLFLSGRYDDAKTYMPKYLMGVNADGVACMYTPMSIQDIRLYNDSELSDGSENDKIRYTFIVPANSLVPSKSITKLQLKNALNEVCAEIELENTIDTSLAASLLIYWELIFANPSPSITITPFVDTININEGGTTTLTATVQHLSDVSVTYMSSDEDIATVDSEGVVTGVNVGVVGIVATATADTTLKATAIITVIASE